MKGFDVLCAAVFRLVLMFGGIGMACVGGAAAAPPLENTAPQRTAVPLDIRYPLYCPFPVSVPDGIPVEAPIDRETPESLLRNLQDLHSTLRHDEALEVAEQLVAMAPDRPASHYNHACVLARLRRCDAAMAALERAVECGWRNLAHMLLDPDLHSISSSERYRSLLNHIEALQRAERPAARPLRTEPWPVIVEELREQAPLLLRRYRIPGAAIALLRDGEVVWCQGFGMAAEDVPMTVDTLVSLRGPIELMTFMAALQQQERGTLDLTALMAGADAGRGPSSRVRSGEEGGGGPGTLVSVPTAWRVDGRDVRLRRRAKLDLPFITLLEWSVELAAEQRLTDYCHQSILEPIGARSTRLVRGDEATTPVMGHSAFGTPRSPMFDRGERIAQATAEDLARLLASCSRAGPWPQMGEGLTQLVAWVNDLQTPGTLRLEALGTRFGPRLQMAEEADGVGGLLRWYPRAGSGIAILYNSDGGFEAAHRLAHFALGGTGDP